MYVWEPSSCMYVCLRAFMRVCMLEAIEHVCIYACMYVWDVWACMYVCMYVCLKQLSVYVCMPQTYIHRPQTYIDLTPCWACMYVICWACMYVSSMYVCLRERRFMYVWMSQTYILSHLTPRWACMYVRYVKCWACMYVSKPCVLLCFLPVGHNARHPSAWPPRDPQKVIHLDTISILVCIHTYILTSRSSH